MCCFLNKGYLSFRFTFTLLFFRSPHYFYNRVTLNESFGMQFRMVMLVVVQMTSLRAA